MRWSFVVLVSLVAIPAWGQENMVQADFRREGERLLEACGSFGLKAIPTGCGYTLFTDHPLHIAASSIAPQNGFGFGLAFVTHYTPNESWRLNWNADAIASPNGSWRAGVYMKIIHTPIENIRVSTGPSAKASKIKLALRPHTLFNLYAQSTSLNKLYFFGLGSDSTPTGRSVFGITETITGINVVKPMTRGVMGKLHLVLLGEVNGRFVNLRGEHGQSGPSIDEVYTETTAPGLANQPGFAQFGEGLRIKPSMFNDHVQLNYLATFQQFLSPANAHYSFRRWTVDLGHTVPLYNRSATYAVNETNGPDECAQALGSVKCPPVALSRNLGGSIGVRLLLSESVKASSNVVPFYFQPTLGGSDVNGNPALSSYQDYRFRGPNLLLLGESFEHSIWGPVGFTFIADQGKVTLTRSDIGFSDLKHSFAAGFTLRAGGFPQVFLLFSWGGREGHHTIASMNTSLLGGSQRPSFF